MKEDISSADESVMNKGEDFYFVRKYDNDPENQSMYDIGTLSLRFIVSINFQSIPRKVSQVAIEFQDVTQAKTFQSKGCYSSLLPEDIIERWNIGIE